MAGLGNVRYRFHYKQLPEADKSAYRTILSSWLKLKPDVTLENCDAFSISRILVALRCDVPELFWVDFRNDFRNITFVTNGRTMVLQGKFLYTNTMITHYKVLLKKAIQDFLDGTDWTKLSKFEKETAVHDFLANGTVYNHENINDVENATIVAPLLMNCGICEGYAKAFKLLCDRVDVTSMIIFGDTTTGEIGGQGGPHAWNMVKINSVCAHVDVTWDSLTTPLSNGRKYRYDYLNLSDKEIETDHSWNRSEYPVSTAEGLCWFSNTGNFMPNTNAFEGFIIKQLKINNDALNVKFGFHFTDTSEVNNFIMQTLVKNLMFTQKGCTISTIFNKSLQTALIQVTK